MHGICVSLPQSELSSIIFFHFFVSSREFKSIAEHMMTQPRAPRRYIFDTALYLYWPAMSQSCILTALPSLPLVSFVEKSQPMVGLTFQSNFFCTYCWSMEVFPTAGSPTTQNLMIRFSSIWDYIVNLTLKVIQVRIYPLFIENMPEPQYSPQKDEQNAAQVQLTLDVLRKIPMSITMLEMPKNTQKFFKAAKEGFEQLRRQFSIICLEIGRIPETEQISAVLAGINQCMTSMGEALIGQIYQMMSTESVMRKEKKKDTNKMFQICSKCLGLEQGQKISNIREQLLADEENDLLRLPAEALEQLYRKDTRLLKRESKMILSVYAGIEDLCYQYDSCVAEDFYQVAFDNILEGLEAKCGALEQSVSSMLRLQDKAIKFGIKEPEDISVVADNSSMEMKIRSLLQNFYARLGLIRSRNSVHVEIQTDIKQNRVLKELQRYKKLVASQNKQFESDKQALIALNQTKMQESQAKLLIYITRNMTLSDQITVLKNQIDSLSVQTAHFKENIRKLEEETTRLKSEIFEQHVEIMQKKDFMRDDKPRRSLGKRTPVNMENRHPKKSVPLLSRPKQLQNEKVEETVKYEKRKGEIRNHRRQKATDNIESYAGSPERNKRFQLDQTGLQGKEGEEEKKVQNWGGIMEEATITNIQSNKAKGEASSSNLQPARKERNSTEPAFNTPFLPFIQRKPPNRDSLLRQIYASEIKGNQPQSCSFQAFVASYEEVMRQLIQTNQGNNAGKKNESRPKLEGVSNGRKYLLKGKPRQPRDQDYSKIRSERGDVTGNTFLEEKQASLKISEEQIMELYRGIENVRQFSNPKMRSKKISVHEFSTSENTFVMELMAAIAYLHAAQPFKYDKLKRFLLRPFDFVAHLGENEPILLNVASSSMKEAIMFVLALHKACPTGTYVCQHLLNFLSHVKTLAGTEEERKGQERKGEERKGEERKGEMRAPRATDTTLKMTAKARKNQFSLDKEYQ